MKERRSISGAEDMLASIRRLVADEVRAGSEPVSGPARLLLTPALRVDPGQLPPKRSEKIRPLRIVLNERRAALATGAVDAPLLLSEDLAVPPETLAAEQEARAAEAAAAPIALRVVSATEAVENAPVAAPPASDFLGRLAELESLLDAQEQPYDFEEGELEADIGSWLSSHAGALSEVPFIDLGQGAAPAANVVPQAPSSAVDDAQLRALIREVLREELAGPMGERVTRNLNRLIRSELARALATRGLG